MAGKEGARGKVIEFNPKDKHRSKAKLKQLKYNDPAKKQLKKERAKKSKDSLVRSSVVRNVGIFIALCFLVYTIKNFI